MMQKKTTVISLFSKLVVTVTASLRANLFHLPTEQISIANKQNTTPVLPLSHLYSWVLLDISWNSSRPVGEGVPPHHGQTLSGGLSGQVQLANSRLRLGFCQVKKNWLSSQGGGKHRDHNTDAVLHCPRLDQLAPEPCTRTVPALMKVMEFSIWLADKGVC